MRALRAIATLILLCQVTVLWASDSMPSQAAIAEQMCKVTACQRNLHVTLKQKDGVIFDRSYDVFPAIVQDTGILVVAGQTVYVEAEVDGDKLVNLHAVETMTHPERTITAHLEQSADGGMMLSLKNPFKAALKFRMGMMPLASDDLYSTSSCPVVAEGGSFEMWPFPIFQVLLGEGHLLSKSDNMSCD